MSNYPITGRVKRAPAKQVKDATVGGDGETKTTKTDADVTGGEKVDQVASTNRCGTQAEKDAGKVKKTCEESGYNKVLKKRKTDPCYNFNSCPPGATPTVVGDKCECKGKEKKTCPDGSTPDADGKCTKTETTEGWDGNLKTGTQARVLQPWEINRLSRGVKSTTRKVNLASKRLDKLGAIRGADGTYSLPEGASPKQQRKFEKQNARLTQFRSQVKNSQTAIDSGRGAGELVRSGQRNTGQDEQTRKQQIEQLKRETAKANAEKAALENKKNEAANDQGIVTGNSQSTGQAAGAIDAATNAATESAPVAGQSAGAIEAGQYVDPNSGKPTTDPQATMAKSRSAYKMTSKHPSIAKLTAGQKTLPQHLQKAIVAKEMKSSNKSRSGFKMRGYGKR